jgi:RAVE protein 1 C terminal
MSSRSPTTASRDSISTSNVEVVDRHFSLIESPLPVKSNSIDRINERVMDLIGRGLHVPAEVLGQAESPSKSGPEQQLQQQQHDQAKHKTILADINVRARRRSQAAVQATQSHAAIAAAAAQFTAVDARASTTASLMTLLTYGGIEVVFSTTSSSLVGVCSRTHFIFQKLHLVSDAAITSLTSNSTSGMLVVAHQDGMIQTYHPQRTDPNKNSFGKYVWVDGITIDASKVFYQSEENPQFCDRRFAQPGQLVDISSSFDNKLLVAHKTQLAVFEAIARRDPNSPRSASGRLLWTTMLPGDIITAKISGDGQAIVVALEGDKDGEGNSVSRTFIHDLEDGSLAQPCLVRSVSVGMVFKPGPVLKHNTPVTRISFRGLGRVTSSTKMDRHGNDLLLTFCESDSTVRIFNQNGWNQLMLWVTPPNSRADWIRGSSAFSLGDFESDKKKKGSRAPSRRPSAGSDLSGGITAGLRNTAGSPTTAAGAWIAEITFRGAFPALRLSRLSYMKRGKDDSQPAHFESVAAILPAGSLVAGSVLNSDDMGLAIQGVWPAWNPWLSEPTGNPHDQVLTGSAMEFLGLSSIPPPHSQFFGDSYLGGTHSPPTELRIASAHSIMGNLVIMEFPLWGDDDFGAMELGSPLRSVLSLSNALPGNPPAMGANNQVLQRASIDYDCSRLCAQIDPGQRSISILWRKQGSQSLYSPHFLEDDSIFAKSISESMLPLTPRWMEDRSVIAAPLALPSLRFPVGTSSVNEEAIVCIKWWPDDSFDGPPLLLALTRTATLVVFEIPPPRSAQEPAMPNVDPFHTSPDGTGDEHDAGESGSDGLDDFVRSEYDVGVTPHPDFGLGLRLESPVDGLLAVAGSFKKHPLNGGMLPAEKTGMIVLGDQVVRVNGVSLENMTFDDIIATVRHVGAEAGPGQPLILRFRPSVNDRASRNGAFMHESLTPVESIPSDQSVGRNRRTIIGLSPKSSKRRHGRKHSDGGSLASMLVGTYGEAQQEFGRAIAVMRKAVPSNGEESFYDKRFIITPWGRGIGAPSPEKHRSAALILVAVGSTILVKRMVLPVKCDPDQAQLVELGSLDLKEGGEIRAVYPVGDDVDNRCYVVSLETGLVVLLFVEILEKAAKASNTPALSVSFRKHNIFVLERDSRHFEIFPFSMNFLAAYERDQDVLIHRRTIKMFTSRSDPMCRRPKSPSAIQDGYFGRDYLEEEIEIALTGSDTAELWDVKVLESGHLDSFPTLIVFLTSEALVYQRRATKAKWMPVVRITYSIIPSSFPLDDEPLIATVNPCDAFPHFLPMIHAVVPSYDEGSYLLSDWHPETLLAYLCTDERGAKVAVREHVEKIVELLAELVDSSSSSQGTTSGRSRLLVAPFHSIGGPKLLTESLTIQSESRPSSGQANLMFTSNPLPDDADRNQGSKKLEKLLSILEAPRRYENTAALAGKSREFQLAMALPSEQNTEDLGGALPPMLEGFSEAELRVLWAITDLVKNPPCYDKMDAEGQLSLAIFALHNSLKKSPQERKVKLASSSLYSNGSIPSFYQRNRSSNSVQETARLPPQCASAAAVSALLSRYQGHLVENVRQTGVKLDWETVRESRAAFWIRSDEKLRQISEQVGQSLYRESRDILKSAIFFLAAGKLRTLRNLAAADSTESGRKFSTFLASFDFSSDRGRSAAEKNAFSLLRKNKYDCAAAFFLLAQPPMLQSAVETIASKMEDWDLAFLVSRLVANAEARGGGQPEMGLGFGGILGGGGGYAGMTMSTAYELEKDQDSFRDWNPSLSIDTTALLENRMLPNVLDDSPFCALLLLWLGRRDEAWHWLSGFVRRENSFFAEFVRDGELSLLHETTQTAKKSQDPTIEMTNSFINFVAGPLLLKQMNAAPRTRAAAAMMIASSLCKAGIELPAIRSLSNADIDEADGVSQEPTPRAKSIRYISTHTQTTTSIFDNFDPAPQAKAPVTPSIFDAFDGPPSQIAPKPSHEEVRSSIFDSFDGPSPLPKTTTPVRAEAGMESLRPFSTTKHVTGNGEMQSSIFDSFDAPPPKAIPQAPSGNKSGMESSIFDSFDALPSKPAVLAPQAEMTSSIFDSFEVPLPYDKVITGCTESTGPDTITALAVAEVDEPQEPLRPLPPLWREWRRQLLISCAARRVLREIATLGSRFYIDEFQPTIAPSGRWSIPIIPTYAAQVLQLHADGNEIVGEIQACLNIMSYTFGIEAGTIVQEALRILESPYQYQRVCFAVLLHLAVEQLDEAEDIVRSTAHGLIEKCSSYSLSNDHIAFSRKTVSHLVSLPQRQTAAYLSWQLEMCLWLHRGGALPLSGVALNQSICAVRIGMLIASWSRDFEVQEIMLRQPADCVVNPIAGRQLCTSLKMISNLVAMEKRASSVGSGGWEFLVDCKRAEAAELLRPRPTGCFIIRPHPEDHGVFTLSFKTNLKPSSDPDDQAIHDGKNESDKADGEQPKTSSKSIKRDDVVQHAIIRLSDSGFRCGSFGPFATLMKLLEAVSGSLPFKLRFDLPPTQGVIRDQGSRPSPNCAFFRKLGLSGGKRLMPCAVGQGISVRSEFVEPHVTEQSEGAKQNPSLVDNRCDASLRPWHLGFFLELVVLSEVRKQLSGVASAKYDSVASMEENDSDSVGSGTYESDETGPEKDYAVASRMLRPLLTWCRMMEISIVDELAPALEDVGLVTGDLSVGPSDISEEKTEGLTAPDGNDNGDWFIRKMIKPGSGVEFRTLRLGEGGETAMVVMFSKKEAVDWFITNKLEERDEDAMKRLDTMEKNRVIETVDLKLLLGKSNKKKQEVKNDDDDGDADDLAVKGIRYRLVDPWEVEPLESREAETRGAALGRHHFHPFGLGRVAASYELTLRSLGGPHLLELWAAAGGGVALTKSIATVHSPWERGAGGDLHVKNGVAAEPDPYDNSIRQHLYRNALFRRLDLPQRFMALLQVELLDLKNLTSPGGSLSLTVYSLLRLKRPTSKAPLTMKARTLDSVATPPTKLGKVSGPNAPASWGSLVRFRFPLPEDTGSDGRSNNIHRESLFKGAPSVLQVSVYEKKFMSDTHLGGADVKLNGLSSGGQMEEWVPLRTETQGINWFARIRLTLRFELMCLTSNSDSVDEMAPSVGLRRIRQLSSVGGLQEDARRTSSTPDLLSYFESMVT